MEYVGIVLLVIYLIQLHNNVQDVEQIKYFNLDNVYVHLDMALIGRINV